MAYLHVRSAFLTRYLIVQVLLIGGSTGTMLEALHVVGDTHESHLTDVSFAFDIHLHICSLIPSWFIINGCLVFELFTL